MNNNFLPHYAVHKNGIIAGFFANFRFLSNFYILENGVCLDQIYFSSVENAYQAAKYPLNERSIFTTIHPGLAKSKGKLAPNFNSKKWDKTKYELMHSLVYQKFHNNPKLKAMLLLTDGYQLEERNDWNDVDWGTDIDGNGENNLGKILMTVREQIKL